MAQQIIMERRVFCQDCKQSREITFEEHSHLFHRGISAFSVLSNHVSNPTSYFPMYAMTARHAALYHKNGKMCTRTIYPEFMDRGNGRVYFEYKMEPGMIAPEDYLFYYFRRHQSARHVMEFKEMHEEALRRSEI